MKSLLVAIVISLAIGAPVLAETDEDAERLRLLRLHKEFLLEQEKNKVVLLDKGTDWSRYRLRSGELVVDGNYGIDLSDQKTIDRIINSVQTIRRYGAACDVVYRFKYKRVPLGVGRTAPKTETRCRDTGCYRLEHSEKTEYGRRKKSINVDQRCLGDF